jgi:hypothetical protein
MKTMNLKVYEALEEVRNSGDCDMIDYHCVIQSLLTMGYDDEADYINDIGRSDYYGLLKEWPNAAD